MVEIEHGLNFLSEVTYRVMIPDSKLKVDHVDGNFVPPCKILLGTRQERLREEEARQPKDDGHAVVQPIPQELDPVHEIGDVARERFPRRVGFAGPHDGDHTDDEAPPELLKVRVHHDEALHGLLKLQEACADDRQQFVEPLKFLYVHTESIIKPGTFRRECGYTSHSQTMLDGILNPSKMSKPTNLWLID